MENNNQLVPYRITFSHLHPSRHQTSPLPLHHLLSLKVNDVYGNCCDEGALVSLFSKKIMLRVTRVLVFQCFSVFLPNLFFFSLYEKSVFDKALYVFPYFFFQTIEYKKQRTKLKGLLLSMMSLPFSLFFFDFDFDFFSLLFVKQWF